MNVFSELVLSRMSEFQQSLLGMRCIMRPSCQSCGSSSGQWRGYRRRKGDGAILHRRWCKQCGKWFSGETYKRDVAPTMTRAEREAALNEHLAFESQQEAYQELRPAGETSGGDSI